MDEILQKLIDETKSLLTGLFDLCDQMDSIGMGTKRWIPDRSTKEVQELVLYTYFLYIATADGEITEPEAAYINTMLGGNYSLSDLRLLAERTKTGADGSEGELPLIFRAAADCDNKNLLPKKISGTVYQIYATIGFSCLLADRHVTQSEYERIIRYLRMIYNWLEANLNSMDGIEEPELVIQKFLQMLTGSKDGEAKAVIQPDEAGRTKADKNRTEQSDAKKKKNAGNGKDAGEEKTLEQLLQELNSLIGLEEVKYDVISLINLVRIRELREKMGLQMPPISLHLVFSGNPGTGKTTVARLLAEIYHKIGILSKGQLVEVDRSGLVAGYVGQTALKVQDVLKEAKGGVLFIDEAYALTPEHAANDYGLEAIDTLVKGMEDMRNDLIVIVAGYTLPMERFIAANPGLKSRFNKFIEFPDYTAEELTAIFRRFCVQNRYRASRPALEFVHQHFEERIDHKPENFANAREARNLFEFAVARQANRVITESDPTEDMITLLRAEDVAGQSQSIGRQQFLTESAMSSLSEKRQGIPTELMGMKLDELELTPRCWHALERAELDSVGRLLDWMDEGKDLAAVENLSEKNEQEIRDGLKKLGWEEP